MFKIKSSNQQCFKTSGVFKVNNVEYVSVLIPQSVPTKRKGHLGVVQTVKVTGLASI